MTYQVILDEVCLCSLRPVFEVLLKLSVAHVQGLTDPTTSEFGGSSEVRGQRSFRYQFSSR